MISRFSFFKPKNATLLHLFVAVCLIGVLSFGVLILRGSALNDITLRVDSLLFCDYFAQITYVSNLHETYLQQGACFPPFAFLLYRLLWRLTPLSIGANYDLYPLYRNNTVCLLVFLLVKMMFVISLFAVVQEYLKKHGAFLAAVVCALLLVSYPFLLTALQRGNCVIWASVLVAYAFLLKDSKSAVNREIALLCIACACGIKIIPAFCGIVYLKEKRYKEAVRLAVYGFIIFFAPFVFFDGITGIKNFFAILTTHTSDYSWSSIKGISYIIFADYWHISESLAVTLASCVQYSFLAISTVCILICKNRWKTLLLICGVLTVFLPESYAYNSCYLLAPLLMFLQDEGASFVTANRKNIAYGVMFAIVFSLAAYFYWIPPLNRYTPLGGVYVVLYALLLFCQIDTIVHKFCVKPLPVNASA